jgi:KipI family sensor histidine kinase inhibitor
MVIDPLVRPLGDCALFVEVATGLLAPADSDDPVRAKLLALRDSLEANPLDGATDVVPSFTGVAVHFDPRSPANAETWAARTSALARRAREVEPTALGPPRTVEIAVRYGGSDGPDLEDVARLAGMDPTDVASSHASALYVVSMIGFIPGFPYLSGLPARLHTPRLAAPRPRVPRGSIAIGGMHTGVYPLETAGGWRIIGRTDAVLFDAHRVHPTLLRVGDRVRFVDAAAVR